MIEKNNQSNQGTVLIVDDTPGNLAVLSDMLSEADYRVLVATDGLSALEQIEFLKPEIILLDVMMPGIDGFETCHRLKNNPTTAAIPIIFMTALSEVEDLIKAFDKGAVDYIVKPIRPAEVIARVAAQLSQSRNLQRAEDTLKHVVFAALAFDQSGIITWLTESASKLLIKFNPAVSESKQDSQCGNNLPPLLLNQLMNCIKPSSTPEQKMTQEIRLGKSFKGKIIPCHQSGEYMLLIQQETDEWDHASMKILFGLTAREAEILMWISRGKTNKEIGLILDTSHRTVNKHLEHIFEKLGVPTRTAAVAKVLNNNKI